MGWKGRSRVFVKDSTQMLRCRALPWLRRVKPSQYTDAKPFKIIQVPPQAIVAMQRRWHGPIELPWLDAGPMKKYASLMRRWHTGRVLSGDWDLATQLFADYHLSRVVQDRFQAGKDWAEIDYVKSSLRKVSKGRPAWGGRCRTPADVWSRCEYLDQLHRQLSQAGYATDPLETDGHPVPYTPLVVNIGRQGEIIRNNDGKHRILLSKVIGIPALSARVFIRHAQWQAVRDQIRQTQDSALIQQYRHHPDLQDILPEGLKPEELQQADAQQQQTAG